MMPAPIGTRYGKWTVLGPGDLVCHKRRDGVDDKVPRWRCRCDCGVEANVYAHVMRNGRSKQCVACRYAGRTTDPLFFYNRFKRGTRSRNTPWRITPAVFRSSFDAQRGLCALTGVELVWPENNRDLTSCRCTASLDRIDSTRGYVPGNIQWVHKAVNMLKGRRTDAELIHWARLIAAHADAKLHEYV